MSIAKLIKLYLEHADQYYRHPDGTPTGEEIGMRHALAPLRKLFGRVLVEDFKPLRLKRVRDSMIERGLCRKTINANIGRIKRMFAWGVENELIPPDRYQALRAVPGLKLGRTLARESEPVKPAPIELVEATLPLVSAQIAAMIRLQLLTGMRSGEMVIMRTCDIDQAGEVWVYVPTHHKTAHHNHVRQVLLGPKSQEVIRPFLRPDKPEAYLFSPADADEEFRRKKHEARKTPMNQGNKPGSNVKRRPKRVPGERYVPQSYGQAISRACEVAFPVPEGSSPDDAKKWKKSHHWHPHQLRHNAATTLRKQFGIDIAQVVLGHKSIAVTAIYAEKDMKAATEVMKKVG